MAGVTPTGFVPKTIGDVTEELNAALRAVFGASVNLDSRSRLGQIRDLVAVPIAEVWNVLELVAGTFDPAGATGFLLDNLASLTGTFRRLAFESTGGVVLSGTAGAAIPAGAVVAVPGGTARFAIDAPVVLVANSPWAASTAFPAGARVTSDLGTWLVGNAGVTGLVAPSGGAATFADGTIVWHRVGNGAASALATVTAESTGPLPGLAYTVTQIETPAAGWTGVLNPLDFDEGANDETDVELRARRQREIAGIGTSPFPALLADLSRVPGVTSTALFENTTDTTVDGVTPHAIEALLEGGADADIRQALFDGKAAGIETCGNVSGSVSDSLGGAHTIKFSRPVGVNIWVTATVLKNPALYPANGDELVKQAIVEWGDRVQLGRDVVAAAIIAQIFQVPGVLDVTNVKIGTAINPVSGATIAISPRQRPVYDTSRISITSSNGVP